MVKLPWWKPQIIRIAAGTVQKHYTLECTNGHDSLFLSKDIPSFLEKKGLRKPNNLYNLIENVLSSYVDSIDIEIGERHWIDQQWLK